MIDNLGVQYSIEDSLYSLADWQDKPGVDFVKYVELAISTYQASDEQQKKQILDYINRIRVRAKQEKPETIELLNKKLEGIPITSDLQVWKIRSFTDQTRPRDVEISEDLQNRIHVIRADMTRHIPIVTLSGRTPDLKGGLINFLRTWNEKGKNELRIAQSVLLSGEDIPGIHINDSFQETARAAVQEFLNSFVPGIQVELSHIETSLKRETQTEDREQLLEVATNARLSVYKVELENNFSLFAPSDRQILQEQLDSVVGRIDELFLSLQKLPSQPERGQDSDNAKDLRELAEGIDRLRESIVNSLENVRKEIMKNHLLDFILLIEKVISSIRTMKQDNPAMRSDAMKCLKLAGGFREYGFEIEGILKDQMNIPESQLLRTADLSSIGRGLTLDILVLYDKMWRAENTVEFLLDQMHVIADIQDLKKKDKSDQSAQQMARLLFDAINRNDSRLQGELFTPVYTQQVKNQLELFLGKNSAPAEVAMKPEDQEDKVMPEEEKDSDLIYSKMTEKFDRFMSPPVGSARNVIESQTRDVYRYLLAVGARSKAKSIQQEYENKVGGPLWTQAYSPDFARDKPESYKSRVLRDLRLP